MKRIFKSIGNLVSLILRINLFLRLYNHVYERLLPYKIIKYIVKFVQLPEKDFEWKIQLLNKERIVTKIYSDNKKTSEFALSYKWHSPSLNFTEYLLLNTFNKSLTWFDIGSNLGLRSLLFLSESVPVIFFEPNKQLNKLNSERCKQNKFKNYQFIEKGIAKEKGELSFYIDKSSYKSSLIRENVTNKEIDHVETIQVDSLDNLIQEINISDNLSRVCIKIDVEGSEIGVLQGAKSFIEKYQPTMIIEVNTKGNHFNEFVNEVLKYNYNIYEIGSFSPKHFYRKVEASFYERIVCNDFFIVKDPDLIKRISEYAI